MCQSLRFNETLHVMYSLQRQVKGTETMFLLRECAVWGYIEVIGVREMPGEDASIVVASS